MSVDDDEVDDALVIRLVMSVIMRLMVLVMRLVASTRVSSVLT